MDRLTCVVLTVSGRVYTKSLLAVYVDVDFVVAEESGLPSGLSERVQSNEDACSDCNREDEQAQTDY
jgi:hypothetical protein